jgi:hypothetical protein
MISFTIWATKACLRGGKRQRNNNITGLLASCDVGNGNMITTFQVKNGDETSSRDIKLQLRKKKLRGSQLSNISY